MGTTMEGYSLSKRLSCVADWIKDTGHRCVADIGTDHGYLPVYLAKNNIADRVIAMDVRIQPLNKAESNVRLYGVQEKVELRLSDGLDELKPLEADTITICGMGGRLIQSILTRGKDKYSENTQIIVSPQSEIKVFRQFLVSAGYTVVRENFIKEDNQFYSIMDCRFNPEFELYLRYGKDNLENRNQDMYQYLNRELDTNLKILDTVTRAGARERKAQVETELYYIRRALEYYSD